MLDFTEPSCENDCGGNSRRDFLRIGTAGLGGLTLASLMRANAAASESGFRGKSVVVLFLCGGASHIETFDPKPDGIGDARSVTGHIGTKIPGVRFGATYQGLAARADRLAVVRSYAPHGIADHAKAIKHVLRGGSDDQSSVGSRFMRFHGVTSAKSGMPSYCSLIHDREPDPQYVEDRDRMNAGSAAGGLGKRFGPFQPGLGGNLDADMQLRVPVKRLDERMSLLKSLDRLERRVDSTGTIDALDAYDRQAVEVILGGNVRKALDLKNEPAKVISQYDTSMYKVGWTKKRASTLGHRLLLARRLCQAGAGFVTVGSPGWDNHANGKHPNVFDGMKLLGRPLDKAVSAFLDDVKRLGLEKDILLVITSEFGRTPKVDQNGGRDHWPGLCPLVFAGGGLETGQVIGESTRSAAEPKTQKIGYDGYLGTLWHSLFDVGRLRLKQGLPTELLRELETAKPIRQLNVG